MGQNYYFSLIIDQLRYIMAFEEMILYIYPTKFIMAIVVETTARYYKPFVLSVPIFAQKGPAKMDQNCTFSIKIIIKMVEIGIDL